jgi:hypothetical protein
MSNVGNVSDLVMNTFKVFNELMIPDRSDISPQR